MSRLSEISFEPLEPYDGKLSCTVLRGERGSNAPDLPDRMALWGDTEAFSKHILFQFRIVTYAGGERHSTLMSLE